MPRAPSYVLDANVFIQAKNAYYAFNICPGFWDALVSHELGSIDRVKTELVSGKDDLVKWVKETMPKSCFAPSNATDVVDCYGEIAIWVHAQKRFTQSERAKFLSGADGWLIAYAKVNGCVVASQEKSAPQSKSVKIPDVCKAFDVKVLDTFDMLRSVGARFTLDDSEE